MKTTLIIFFNSLILLIMTSFIYQKCSDLPGRIKETYSLRHRDKIEVPLLPGIVEKFLWVPPVDTLISHRKEKDGKTIYDVSYDIDEMRTRKVEAVSEGARKFLILTGGSNTFGEGIAQGSELGSVLQTNYKNVRVMNLAYRGYGPYQALGQMEAINWDLIPQKEGMVLYHLLDFHFNRLLITQLYLKWSSGLAPFYQYENGYFAFKGPIKDQAQFQWPLFLLKFMPFDVIQHFFPEPKIDDFAIEMMTQIFVQMKKTIRLKNPEASLCVLISPFYNFSNSDWGLKFIKSLKKNAITVLNVPEIKYDREYFFPHDSHLTPKAIARLSPEIVKQLEIIGFSDE